TSRASALIATPIAPKATAPAASAATQRPKRPQSRFTNRPMPHSITSVTAKAHTALSTSLYPRSESRPPRPGARRLTARASRARLGRAGGQAPGDDVQGRLRALEAQDVEALAQQREAAAAQEDVQIAAGQPRELTGQRRVGVREARLDRGLHDLRLDRVLDVVD